MRHCAQWLLHVHQPEEGMHTSGAVVVEVVEAGQAIAEARLLLISSPLPEAMEV